MSLIKNTPEYVLYKMCKLLDQSVAACDPLKLNDFFARQFSEMSEQGCTKELTDFITGHIHKLGYERIKTLNETEAMAATRDLAMFASALVRWGVPVSNVPIVERLLEDLSQTTCEVPADTVFSYGPRNPTGETRRQFTIAQKESLFIQSFTDGMRELSVCLAGLEYTRNISVFDQLYPLIIGEIKNSFSEMIKAMMVVRSKVTPEFFTKKLRPFFEPKVIGGRKYFAPGGAQMPITVIDLMLWGIEESSTLYVRYWNENIQYLPKAMRSRIGTIMRGPSIVKTIEGACRRTESNEILSATKVTIDAVQGLLTEIERFRYPHLSVAKANMGMRVKGAVGSGGYDILILEYLIEQTKAAKQRLERLK